MEKLNRGHLAIDLRFDGFEHEIRGHPNKGRALQIMAPLIARAGQGLAQRCKYTIEGRIITLLIDF